MVPCADASFRTLHRVPPKIHDVCAFSASDRSINEFQRLNKIEEGTYGEVFRVEDVVTKEVLAVKRFKLKNEESGFPITALRASNMYIYIPSPPLHNLSLPCRALHVVVGQAVRRTLKRAQHK